MTSVSGVRGIVGEGMTPEVALLWSCGFGSWLKGGKVVVGRDSRPSGVMLNYAVKAGLSSAGCDIDDVGVVPTPTAVLATQRRGAAGGIVITASHNPQEWNALKFVRHDGRMLTTSDFSDLERIVAEGPIRSAAWNKLGTAFDWDGAGLMYIGAVSGLSALDLAAITRKRLRVAIDCVNGAGSVLYPELLEALCCDVVRINCDGSGLFPHPPEPLPANIAELCRVVVDEKCAVGFAVDPDGDRLSVVDEQGRPLGEELTLALAVTSALEIQPSPVVINSLTSQVIDDIAAKFGVECHRTRVGEANVAARMHEIGAFIGGEGNGGVILKELHLVRDAGVGMAIIINRLASRRQTVSEMAAELPPYSMIKASYRLGDETPSELIDEIATLYPHDEISRIDGLKVVSEHGWVQVRPSNTEPILRVFAEADSEDLAKQMVDEMMKKINELTSRPINNR